LKPTFEDSTAKHPKGQRWHAEMYKRVSVALLVREAKTLGCGLAEDVCVRKEFRGKQLDAPI
jgi:hypothetical protein